MIIFFKKIVQNPQHESMNDSFHLRKRFVSTPGDQPKTVLLRKKIHPPSNEVIRPSKGRMIIWHSFKSVELKENMMKFLINRQMAPLKRALVRSLVRKQTFGNSLFI